MCNRKDRVNTTTPHDPRRSDTETQTPAPLTTGVLKKGNEIIFTDCKGLVVSPKSGDSTQKISD